MPRAAEPPARGSGPARAARRRSRRGSWSSRRRRADGLDASGEGGLVDRADVASGDDAIGADEESLRNAEHAVGERDPAGIVDDRRPDHAHVTYVGTARVERVLVEDADDDHVAPAVALVHADERGVLLLAGEAPRGERRSRRPPRPARATRRAGSPGPGSSPTRETGRRTR